MIEMPGQRSICSLPRQVQADVVPVKFATDRRFGLPGDLFLQEGEVHVWFVRLPKMSAHFESILEILAPDEVARAARFRFDGNRNEYILTRGFLRHILSSYAGSAPHLLRFCYNSYGKPTLAAPWCGNRLEFSVSHSRGVAVCAVMRDGQVGVDLEYLHQDVEFDQIAEQFFSPREMSLFRRLPSNKKRVAFFSCWTRKEAYIKARGEGMFLDLRSFDVAFAQDQPASVFIGTDNPSETRRWSLADLSAPVGYTASVAFEGVVGRIRSWEWPPDRTRLQTDQTQASQSKSRS